MNNHEKLILESFERIFEKRLQTNDQLLKLIKHKVENGEVLEDDVQPLLGKMFPPVLDEEGNVLQPAPVIEFNVADPAMSIEERVEHLEELTLINEGVVVNE